MTLHGWLYIVGISLLGGFSQLWLKLGVRKSRFSTLWLPVGILGFGCWILLLFHGASNVQFEVWFTIPFSMILVLLLSVFLLKERLSITKITAYCLIIAGIWQIQPIPKFW